MKIKVEAILSLSLFAFVTSCSLEHDADYYGNDLTSKSRGSASECCQDCTALANCAGYVWSNGICWLKSKLVGKSYKPGVIAGYLPASCSPIEENIDYQGNDIGSTQRADAALCCQDCSSTPNCMLFVWTNWQGGTCWLKSKAGARVASAGARASSRQTNQCSPIEENTDYWGNDITTTSRASADQCCTDCSSNSQCVVYVWYNGVCYLKSKRGMRSTVAGARSSGTISSTPPSLSIPNPVAKFTYPSQWFSGTYPMVTNLKGCQSEVRASAGKIAPFHEELSMVFRGPMNIYNIAVFQQSDSKWKRTSNYVAGGSSSNIAFMTNANPAKFNGGSPQSYATSDGVGFSSGPTNFGGWLRDASNPSSPNIGPGITTGAEVNIMQSSKCIANTCLGSFDPTFGLNGWGGSKIFVTKVKFGTTGLPAIWLLNAQVVRANQYACNCRGVGDPGGCGELDVAEAIYPGVDTIATHKYYLNAKPSTGNDIWTTRPTANPATFVTILDEGSGTIKVMRFSENDMTLFDVDEISKEFVDNLISK